MDSPGMYNPRRCAISKSEVRYDIAIGISFWLGLLIVALIYSPGLSGSFIFDDFPNLELLGAGDGVNDWESLRHYIMSGFSGPTGRPISLLSFLIDANNWPADPSDFKYTNICIHLLNGALLFLVIVRILSIHEGKDQPGSSGKAAALLVALAWMLHPNLVSTTLYSVQRMAMLPMFFGLLVLYIWLEARPYTVDRPKYAYFWLTFALVVPGTLALFSKENAALLPLLILTVEGTVIAKSRLRPLSRTWKTVFLVLPALFVVFYLLYRASENGWFAQYAGRDFSPYERILTQFRIVLDYIFHWFIPQLYTTGLFHDNIEISRGFLEPARTFGALLMVAGLLTSSLIFRKKYPLYALAITFFMASQLIESTVLPLELEFEHRIYLGSGFLFLPFFYSSLKSRKSVIALYSVAFYIAILALFCWQSASLWGHYPTMIRVWAEKAPYSERAQVEVSKQLYESGEVKKSLQVLDQASERMPDAFRLRMIQVLVQCRFETSNGNDKSTVLDLALITEYRPQWFDSMQHFLQWSQEPWCKNLGIDYFEKVVDNLLSNEKNRRDGSKGYSQLTYLKGIASLLNRDIDNARPYFAKTVELRDNVQKLMNIAGYLATAGYYHDALRYAERAREKLASGDVTGKELAEAPPIRDVEIFIRTVHKDMQKND